MSIWKSIFGKKPKFNEEPDRSLKVDFHSHLLAGIDDGCPEWDITLNCLQLLKEQGIESVITTPHILSGLYPNTPEIVLGKLAELKELTWFKSLDMKVEAAAEYYVDEWFMDELAKGKPFLTCGENHILIETNYVEKPPYLEEAIFNLIIGGYKVVYAHPERYHYLLKDFKLFERMHDTGVLFQLNLMSMTGHYGPQVKAASDYLIKHDLVDLVGSDIHKPEHAALIGRLKHSESYAKVAEAIKRTNGLMGTKMN